ncbi:MAG: ATPase [Firmicutes bacterium HGW-Firmicutes-21]|nr:MAG: ATPase [Firmicutes bacterium HGW-Firmicutes-21]
MWHSKTTAFICDKLNTSKEGLSSAEASARLNANGKNLLEHKKKKSVVTRFFIAMTDKMTVILLIAAAVSFAASAISGEKNADPLIILMIVVLNAAIGVFQESKAEKALEALRSLSSPETTVVRDKRAVKIKSEDIAIGDFVLLEKGCFVPADIRLTDSNELIIDESALTGESLGVNKQADILFPEKTHITDIHNMAWSGTAIVGGRGSGIAVATGMNTYVGSIAKMLDGDSGQKTPLQQRLSKVSGVLGNAALIICAVIFILSIIEGLPASEMFLTSVSLSVAAIPEGLPAIVTIVLSIGVQMMARQKAVVKRLPAVETLGCASVICSDKTGTLTQNKMTVTEVFGDAKKLSLPFILCNNFSSPTETALLDYAKMFVPDTDAIITKFERINEIPFDSKKKLMVTTHKYGSRFVIYIKGAPDVLLPLCRGGKGAAERAVSDMAGRALRVMAFARAESALPPADPFEASYELVGLCGMLDPPRPEVYEAVAVCKRAGIRPVMITGDHLDTAIAIGKSIGIYNDGDECHTEKELEHLDKRQLAEAVTKCSIFARTTPEFKVKIVEAYQQNGMVVAMTGDGVNDAPALKKADIGCAMGISGTDVAKQAADLILTDDNFSTIIEAVRQGRGIYSNIKKAVHFLLSCNIGEIITVFAAILLGLPSPLTAIQLLWVNLVTDSLPAISLGLEKTERDVMKQKPIKKGESLFSGGMVLEMAAGGILIGVLSLIAYIIGIRLGGQSLGRTMCFLVLSISQLFHSFNLHSRRSLFKSSILSNPFLVLSFFVCLSLQLAVVLIPLLSGLFGTVMMNGREWAIVFLLAVVPLAASEIYKSLIKFCSNN